MLYHYKIRCENHKREGSYILTGKIRAQDRKRAVQTLEERYGYDPTEIIMVQPVEEPVLGFEM